MRCCLLQLDEITLNLLLSKMFVYATQKLETAGRYNKRGLLLYGGVVTAMWAVLVNICNFEF